MNLLFFLFTWFRTCWRRWCFTFVFNIFYNIFYNFSNNTIKNIKKSFPIPNKRLCNVCMPLEVRPSYIQATKTKKNLKTLTSKTRHLNQASAYLRCLGFGVVCIYWPTDWLKSRKNGNFRADPLANIIFICHIGHKISLNSYMVCPF